jgi:hypothetical protein
MLSIAENRGETLPTERVGVVVYILTKNAGQKFTTAYFAKQTGLRHHSTWVLLCKLSRVLPIVQDLDGWWMADE